MPVRVRRSNRLRPGPAPRNDNHVGGAGWGQINQQVIRSKTVGGRLHRFWHEADLR
jgi:hypothetical protein